MSLLIPFGAFTQQCEEIEKQLEIYGHVEVNDLGSSKGVRRVSFLVDAPGQGRADRRDLRVRRAISPCS